MKTEVGFGVLGFNRPDILINTLTSLLSQKPFEVVIFIDRANDVKNITANDRCIAIANAIAKMHKNVRLFVYDEPQGVEAGVCNSVQSMIDNYDAFVFLEDDNFPTKSAVEVFEADLERIKQEESVYSVYGHHFNIPQEILGEASIQRFQGWGWGGWSDRIDPIFKVVKDLVLRTPRSEYKHVIQGMLTPDVLTRLRITKHRSTEQTVIQHQPWDETTAVITAYMNMWHMPTSKRVIHNCGEYGVHFKGEKIIRQHEYNMIPPENVWSYYDR